MELLAENNDRLLYELEQFLIRNGASDYLHYFLRSMYPRIESGEIIIILAPIDTALQRLVEKSGKTLEEIANLPEGRNMLTNFLSSSYFQEKPPVYTAINGSYIQTMESLNRLNYTSYIKLGNIFVETVNGIINMPGQLDQLKQANPANIIPQVRSGIIGDNLIAGFDDLPSELIREITLDLPLTDLVNSCGISKRFNDTVCNDERFWNEKTRYEFPRQSLIGNNWKNTYRTAIKQLYITGQLYAEPQLKPEVVEGLNQITMIACGGSHAAVIADGLLYTFGDDSDGQLGYYLVDLSEDEQGIWNIPEGFEYDVTFVACGENHTAAVSGGRLYTFGDNNSGQLGHGDGGNRAQPALIEELDNVTFVACGNNHTAAIAGGLLYTVGNSAHGKLGHGNRNESLIRFKLVEGLTNVTAVACGGDHTAAIANGKLYTFGYGADGQLGYGNQEHLNYSFRPKLVEKLDNGQALTNVTAVSCGDTHTAVIANGKLYTFGNGSDGQLGHGERKNQYKPKIVRGLDNVTAVACGAEYTAVIAGGRVYTFGNGQFGRLGQHDVKDRLKPTIIKELQGATMIAASHNITAIVAT